MREITPEDRLGFSDNGFVVVDEILSSSDVNAVLAAADRIHRGEYTNDRRPPPLRKRIEHLGRDESIKWYLNTRIVDDELWRVTTSPGLGRAAATLLQSRSVSLVEDQLLDKPGPGLPCSYHQDYGYWLFSESTQWISCWIALVDMTVDMGPIQLIPGSQRWGYTANPLELIAGKEDTWLDAVERGRPHGEAIVEPVTVCVRAGGGVFFHGLTFHGSARNSSSTCRRAFSIHWAGEDCRVNRSKLSDYKYPYFFAGILDGGRVVNKYMPLVFDEAQNSWEAGK